MDADVAIRRAGADDVHLLAGLNAIAQDLHVAHRPDVFKPTDLEEVAAWFAAGLASGGLLVWLAVAEDAAVGYVAVCPRESAEHVFCSARSWWEVDQIVVDEAWRRRGIAGALLRVAAREAAAAGADGLQLSCWTFNPTAQEAFRRLGFVPLSTRFGLDLRRPAE